MAYNISDVRYRKGSGELRIAVRDVRALRERHAGEPLAESNWLEELSVDGLPDDTLVTIRNPWWQGECSGRSAAVMDECLAKTVGAARLRVVWEDGDHIETVTVLDGVITREDDE